MLHQNSVQHRDVHAAMHPKAIGGNRVLDELYDARIKIIKILEPGGTDSKPLQKLHVGYLLYLLKK